MRRKRSLSLTLIVTCLIFSSTARSFCQGQQGEVLLDKNLKLALELLSPLSTATNRKGDKFSCKVLSPIAHAGALVEGHVRKAKRSGKEKGKSEMDLAFDTITLPDGRVGNFNAQVIEVFDVVDAGDQGRADPEGTVKAKSTVKRDAVKIGVGALAGAIIGGLLGGGKGAAIGAAIGAGIGVSTTLATRGPDLEFKQRTQFTVILNSSTRQTGTAQVVNSVEKEAPPADAGMPGRPTLKPRETSAADSTPTGGPATVESLPTPRPSQPTKPGAPSTRSQVYSGNKNFRLTVPANWRQSSSSDPVTLAPDRGHIIHQGKLNLTHGITAGTLKPQSSDLREASGRFVGALLQVNSYLRQQGDSRDETIMGRGARAATLSGMSEVTGAVEIVTIYTAMMRDGRIFYMITVTPEEDQATYQPTFHNILRSIQFSD